jgi:hypothetical protein
VHGIQKFSYDSSDTSKRLTIRNNYIGTNSNFDQLSISNNAIQISKGSATIEGNYIANVVAGSYGIFVSTFGGLVNETIIGTENFSEYATKKNVIFNCADSAIYRNGEPNVVILTSPYFLVHSKLVN